MNFSTDTIFVYSIYFIPKLLMKHIIYLHIIWIHLRLIIKIKKYNDERVKGLYMFCFQNLLTLI